MIHCDYSFSLNLEGVAGIRDLKRFKFFFPKKSELKITRFKKVLWFKCFILYIIIK